MAERKSGPVKPPTIDLTARERDKEAPKEPQTEKPEAATAKPVAGAAAQKAKPESPAGTETAATAAAKPAASGKADTSEPDAPAPAPARAAPPRSGALIAGIAGAVIGGVLGLGAAYELALFGYWTSGNKKQEIASLSNEIGSLYVKKSDIGGVIDRALGEVKSGVAELGARVTALENAKPADAGPAVTALEERVTTLEYDLESLSNKIGTLSGKLDAATIAGGDQAAVKAVTGLSGRIDGLSTQLDALSSRVKTLEDRKTVAPETVSALADSVQALKTELGQVSSGLAALASAPAPKPVDLRLPLALSSLSAALDSGAPFVADLELIHAALPDLAIPAEVSAAAPSGLGRPADLVTRFEAKVPAMLAARPVDANTDWTTRLMDQLKALVALRPVATGADNTPEARIGLIETALAAHDYAAADSAFRQLPEAMQAEAGGLGTDIARFAATADLVRQARAAALKLAGAAS